MKNLITIISFFFALGLFSQNVILKGKTESYFSNKKIKDVQIQILIGDSLIGEAHSNGSFKIAINTRAIIKVLFKKQDYIDKFFLINTKDIPNYYLNKKFTIKADVSIIRKDKYMEDNTIENAVAYAYFNKKYKGFIWDPEYTKKAQVAMDVQVFPLEEVIKLDSALNPKDQKYYFQNGINFYANLTLKPQQVFREQINIKTKSKIKYPVVNGYLYGKYQYFFIQNELDSLNQITKILSPESPQFEDLGKAFKYCKVLDTMILNNKLAATGFWLNLVNYASDENIKSYAKIAVKIKDIEKKFASIEMTDAQLSFYSDLKNAAKAAVQLDQLVTSLKGYELKDPKNYEHPLKLFREQIKILSKNCELMK